MSIIVTVLSFLFILFMTIAPLWYFYWSGVEQTDFTEVLDSEIAFREQIKEKS